MENFNEQYNYIGSSKKQKKFTHLIFKFSRDINFISWIHDTMYELILKLNSWTLFAICSILVDLIFLLGGIWKCLFKLNVIKGIIESVLIIFAWCLITLYKPIYICKRK